MQTRTFAAIAFAAMLLLSGCLGVNSPGISSPDASPTTSFPASESTSSPTPTLTPPPAPGRAPVTSLPSVPECFTEAVPRPDAVDRRDPSEYPTPPSTLTTSSLVNWTRAFEIAYFRNAMLADEPGDDEYNLSEATATAEIRRVTNTTAGYILRVSDFGARNYESGLHGDHWISVGYVINATHVVRVPLDDRDGAVSASDGTVVITRQ